MLEMIKKILDYTEIDGYEIRDTKIHGWEFYYIRHKLDQNRAKDIETIRVKVFKKLEDGKYLGSASGEIFASASKEEAERVIQGLVMKASLVKNPAYELVKPNAQLPYQHHPVNIENNVKDYIEALNSVPETGSEDLNSYEIFANDITVTILNSEGVNVTYEYPSSMVEVVVNARKDAHEIELYRMYQGGSCDKNSLVKDITETLHYGKDKLVALNTPELNKAPVVFSTDAAIRIYEYYASKTNAANKYQKLSDWQIGTPIAQQVNGDKVTVTGVHELANSSSNYPYDAEGSLIVDKCLIKDNVPQNFWGDRQFSQYLGLKESSSLSNFKVEPGSKSESELRKGDYLEIVEFSDFQVNAMIGNIAGEIRLGYWHHDGKVTIVSGGSVSGNMSNLIKDMYLSKELKQYNNWLIPAVTRMEEVIITGIE